MHLINSITLITKYSSYTYFK